MLRYLSDAYRAARQTIPDDAKTEDLLDLIEWLGELVRQVDSSLLDEWESMVAALRGSRRSAGASPVRSARAAVGALQPARVPGARAQRAVPPGAARGAARRGTSWASWMPHPAATRTAGADALDPYFDEHDVMGTGGGRPRPRR